MGRAVQRPLQAAAAVSTLWITAENASVTIRRGEGHNVKHAYIASLFKFKISISFLEFREESELVPPEFAHILTPKLFSVSSCTGGGGALPLASLRLMASPLQLTYSFMWQVIRQRVVRLYPKVEGFVTMVTQTVPELMSSKQTAQLLLGLRARVRVD